MKYPENVPRKYLRDELENVSFVGFKEMYRFTLLPDFSRIKNNSLAPVLPSAIYVRVDPHLDITLKLAIRHFHIKLKFQKYLVTRWCLKQTSSIDNN